MIKIYSKSFAEAIGNVIYTGKNTFVLTADYLFEINFDRHGNVSKYITKSKTVYIEFFI